MAKQVLSPSPYSKPGELHYSSLHLEHANTASQYPQEGSSAYSLGYDPHRYPQQTSTALQRPQNSQGMARQISGPLHTAADITQENAPSHSRHFDDTFPQYHGDSNNEGYGVQFDNHQPAPSIGLYQSQDHKLPDLPASGRPDFEDNSYHGSPQISTQPTQSQGTRRTRSGRPMGTKGAQDVAKADEARVARSPRAKKTLKQGKGDKPKVPRLTAPLSELTNGFDHIPVRDMEEWVTRPMEVRRQEVEKRNGYVTRPMNSFMLYRSAYAERTKLWCLQNNHQVVSSVSGVSWPLEPSSVRDRYNDLAKIERLNHQNAHPGYKFSPSKAQNTKRKFSDDEKSELSDLDDPDEDYGKSLEIRTKRRKKGGQSKKHGKEAGYPVNSAFGLGDHHRPLDIRNGLNKSSYQATNPGKPLPAVMDTTGLYGHYYQSTIRQNASTPNVEDVTMRKTEAPGMHYIGTPPLIGLPGGHQYDLMHMSFVNSSASLDTMKVDPSLLEYDSQHAIPVTEDRFSEESVASLNSSLLGHMSDAQFASPYAIENLPSESLHDYLGSQVYADHRQTHGYQPGEHKLLDFGLLHANDNQHEQWHMNDDTEELDPGSEYDKWMDDGLRE
ncbi:MAG: hypothetical protein M1839_000971 [Geoglossum umbratile]|nr:MAG: hypothetical protein M1839_000971 [Geoglossum umbratile]